LIASLLSSNEMSRMWRAIGRDIFNTLLPSDEMRRMRRAVGSNVFSALLSREKVRVMRLCVCCDFRAPLLLLVYSAELYGISMRKGPTLNWDCKCNRC
jgi:hypothetical protein